MEHVKQIIEQLKKFYFLNHPDSDSFNVEIANTIAREGLQEYTNLIVSKVNEGIFLDLLHQSPDKNVKFNTADSSVVRHLLNLPDYREPRPGKTAEGPIMNKSAESLTETQYQGSAVSIPTKYVDKFRAMIQILNALGLMQKYTLSKALTNIEDFIIYPDHYLTPEGATFFDLFRDIFINRIVVHRPVVTYVQDIYKAWKNGDKDALKVLLDQSDILKELGEEGQKEAEAKLKWAAAQTDTEPRKQVNSDKNLAQTMAQDIQNMVQKLDQTYHKDVSGEIKTLIGAEVDPDTADFILPNIEFKQPETPIENDILDKIIEEAQNVQKTLGNE